MPRPPLGLGAWGHISTVRISPAAYRARARFRDFDGVTRLVECSGQSASKAETALQEKLRNRARPSSQDITGTTRLTALADAWLAEIRDSDRAVGTREKYEDLVERHLRPALGSLRVQELSVGLLDRHLQAVRAGAGDATAKMLRTVLRGVVDVAVRHDALQINLAGQTRPIATKTKAVFALSVEDVTRLRHAIAADTTAVRADLPDLVDIMLATGCRINEALALRWPDVDLKSEPATVDVMGTVVRHRRTGLSIQSHPKTEASKRKLQLPPFAVEVLLRRSVEQPPNELDVVFPSSTGTLRDSHNLSRQWRDFQNRDPRWRPVTSHTFRKTVATLIARRFGSQVASEQLGHITDNPTKKYYIEPTHAGPDVRSALAAFGDLRGKNDG